MAQIPSPVPVAAAKVWLFQLFPILCCILLVISHVAASSDTDWTASLQTQGDASTTKEQDNVLKVKVTDMLEEESKPSMHQQQEQLAALLLQDSCGTPVGMSKIRWWGGKTFAQPSTSYEDRYEQIHTWLILSVWTHAWQPAMICKKSDKTPRQRRDILTTRAKWFVALMTTMNVFLSMRGLQVLVSHNDNPLCKHCSRSVYQGMSCTLISFMRSCIGVRRLCCMVGMCIAWWTIRMIVLPLVRSL